MSKRKEGKIINCKACEKEFYVPKYRIETAKFCSLNCQNHLQYEKYIFKCKGCEKEVVASPSRRNYKKQFCSMECLESVRKSVTERRKDQRLAVIKKRGTHSSRKLRKYIFNFKERKCELCGYNEFDFCLDLHHINGNPNENTLENVKVLCVMCHRKVHKGVLKCL